MFSTKCYETTDLYRLIDNEIEDVSQKILDQYIRKIDFQKHLIENSLENAVGYEKMFHMVKHADVIMVNFYELKQRYVLE